MIRFVLTHASPARSTHSLSLMESLAVPTTTNCHLIMMIHPQQSEPPTVELHGCEILQLPPLVMFALCRLRHRHRPPLAAFTLLHHCREPYPHWLFLPSHKLRHLCNGVHLSLQFSYHPQFGALPGLRDGATTLVFSLLTHCWKTCVVPLPVGLIMMI